MGCLKQRNEVILRSRFSPFSSSLTISPSKVNPLRQGVTAGLSNYLHFSLYLLRFHHVETVPYFSASSLTRSIFFSGSSVMIMKSPVITPIHCPKGKAILEAGEVRIVKVEARRKVEEVLRSLQSSL